MKFRIAAGGLVVVVCVAVWASQARSQEEQGDKGGMSPEMQKQMMEGMQAWVTSMSPGKGHEWLEHFVGDWKVTFRMWWGGPGSEPIETDGTAKVRWILGKRFLQEDMDAKMMMPNEKGEMTPTPYEGHGIIGYNNLHNMYEGFWASTAESALLPFRGVADPAGTVFRYWGTMDEPMLGIVGRYVKYETRIINDDKHVFAVYDLHAADDYKVIEIEYERK